MGLRGSGYENKDEDEDDRFNYKNSVLLIHPFLHILSHTSITALQKPLTNPSFISNPASLVFDLPASFSILLLPC